MDTNSIGCIECTSFHHAISSSFHLSADHASRCSHYFIRHWQLAYFMNRSSYSGFLDYADTIYTVVIQDDLRYIPYDAQIRLSFRKPKNENLPAYVIVKRIAP